MKPDRTGPFLFFLTFFYPIKHGFFENPVAVRLVRFVVCVWHAFSIAERDGAA